MRINVFIGIADGSAEFIHRPFKTLNDFHRSFDNIYLGLI